MGAPSPRCAAEFKQEAVELYGKSGTPYAEVARGLGCDAGGLSDWVKKADAADCGAGDDPFQMADVSANLKLTTWDCGGNPGPKPSYAARPKSLRYCMGLL